MSRKIFKRLLIVCITAFIMAALAVVLCANYLLSYKPTVGDNDKNTYIVTDEKGNRQVITLENKEGNYNFLVLGHDRAALLTDVIMLINYDITDSKVTIMQFPRDTYVSYGVPTSKINATFSTYYSQALNEGKSEEEARMSGLREFGDILEEALGINIYKCAIMNLDGFVNIVDALGGVEMNVPYRLNYSDPGQNLYIPLSRIPDSYRSRGGAVRSFPSRISSGGYRARKCSENIHVRFYTEGKELSEYFQRRYAYDRSYRDNRQSYYRYNGFRFCLLCEGNARQGRSFEYKNAYRSRRAA